MPKVKADKYRDAYPEIGTISKGTPKKEYTKKDGTKGETVGSDTLGHLMRFESPYAEVRRAFLENVKGAKEIRDGKDTYITFPQVTICFVFRDNDPLLELSANFKVSNEWWNQQTKTYVQSCDGTRVYLENKDGFIRDCDRPCQKDCGCVPNGDLYFYVKELKPKKGQYLPFGLVKTSRSSVYDVEQMKNTLKTYQQMFVNKTGYSIVGIPFILSKSERSIKANKYGRMNRWMIDITVDPTWLNDQIADIENFEDIYKVFDYQSADSKDGTFMTINRVEGVAVSEHIHESTWPTDNHAHADSKTNYNKPQINAIDEFTDKADKVTESLRDGIDDKPTEQVKQDLWPDDVLSEVPKKQDAWYFSGKVDPSPIKEYLERNGWAYNDSFVAKTGNEGQDTENLKEFFFGEVEQWLGIDEKQARKLLAEYYNNRVIEGNLSTQFEYGYHLLACTLDGAIAITNALTDNKYWAETKKGDSYKNFKYFEASYKKADPTNQPFPQNGDGYGWARVIDLLVARYEQEKAGITKESASEFTTEMYAPPAGELPDMADNEVVNDVSQDENYEELFNYEYEPKNNSEQVQRQANVEDIFDGW